MMYCEKCGNEISEPMNFCGNCGNKIADKESVDELIDSIVNENNLAMPWEVKERKRIADVDIIDLELEKAEYKLDNGDLSGAEKIFEELALRYDDTKAWRGVGEIKFKQLESGKSTVAQVLNCFNKMLCSTHKPDQRSKENAQKLFVSLSLSWVMDFAPKTWAIKRKTFKSKKDKEVLRFYETTKYELFRAVNNYCFDNNEVYSEFLDTLRKYSPPGFLNKATALVSEAEYDSLTKDLYESFRAVRL